MKIEFHSMNRVCGMINEPVNVEVADHDDNKSFNFETALTSVFFWLQNSPKCAKNKNGMGIVCCNIPVLSRKKLSTSLATKNTAFLL
jgi:hypothetical protein